MAPALTHHFLPYSRIYLAERTGTRTFHHTIIQNLFCSWTFNHVIYELIKRLDEIVCSYETTVDGRKMAHVVMRATLTNNSSVTSVTQEQSDVGLSSLSLGLLPSTLSLEKSCILPLHTIRRYKYSRR